MSRDPNLTAAEARLKAAQDKARRRKMGRPLALGPRALDAAAVIGPLDLAAAQAFWRRHARPGTKRILEAVPDA